MQGMSPLRPASFFDWGRSTLSDWKLTYDPGFDLVEQPPAYEPPQHWTPEHVMHRLVQAWETLGRIRMRVGPIGYKARWPAYLIEYEDLVAQESPAPGETVSQAEQRRRGERPLIVLPPSPLALSLMEEAFEWPMTYLRGRKDIAIVRWSHLRFRDRPSQSAIINHAFSEASTIAEGLIKAGKVVR